MGRSWGRSAGLLLAATLAAAAAAAVNGCSSGGGGAAPPGTPSGVANRAAATTALDRAIEDAWAAANVTPAEPIDDATYLRRVSLDLVGRVPTLDEVRAFDADASADKRVAAVNRLLADPSHAKHLALVWDEILMGPLTKANLIDRGAFMRWLELRFAEKASWDAIVRELVTATGRSSAGGDRGPEAFTGGVERARAEQKEGVNAATNFVLRHVRTPGDLGGDVSKTFLGVQIQCAQCHDHKSEKWKQADFNGFAATFTHVAPKPVEREGKRIPVFDLENAKAAPRRLMKDASYASIAKSPPRALDGTTLEGEDPREALAAWITRPSNPWFAKAMVNRVWAQIFGSGFVDPPDDFRDSVPALAPAVLEQLAKDFTDAKFDLDALYREILSCRAYATSVASGDRAARDALFSHNVLVGMSSDQLLDSIFAATGLEDALSNVKRIDPETVKLAVRRKVRFVFDDDTESNGADFDGTVQQALFLMNGGLVAIGSSVVPDDALDHLFDAKASDEDIVRELYLRTLSRAPRADELASWKTFLSEERAFDERPPPDAPPVVKKATKQPTREPLPAKRLASRAKTPRQQAVEDMFWALLNSSEFFFRR
ncbi:MAG: DUF1549 domain-containing protein [Polyangiaceae bacterium]